MDKARRLDLDLRLLKLDNIDPHSMTIDEWLQSAIDCEDTKKVLGPFDPAYVHFVEQEALCFRAAKYLEDLASLEAENADKPAD